MAGRPKRHHSRQGGSRPTRIGTTPRGSAGLRPTRSIPSSPGSEIGGPKREQVASIGLPRGAGSWGTANNIAEISGDRAAILRASLPPKPRPSKPQWSQPVATRQTKQRGNASKRNSGLTIRVHIARKRLPGGRPNASQNLKQRKCSLPDERKPADRRNERRADKHDRIMRHRDGHGYRYNDNRSAEEPHAPQRTA